jgi:hypothetical protein
MSSGNHLDIEIVQIFIAVIGIALAVSTTLVGISQYRVQNRQKRAEFFIQLRRKLKENPIFKQICNLNESDSEELRKISLQDKRDFLSLFEEVALMMNSGLISPKVANHMFGYYAIRCTTCVNFWKDQDGKKQLSPTDDYFSLFQNFVIQMDEIANKMNRSKEYTNSLKF